VNAGQLGARPSPPDGQAQAPNPDVRPASQAGGTPTHLFDAVSTQREKVLGAFDMQRNAILQAVADQREAALAPIRAVHARQAAPGQTSEGQPNIVRPPSTPPVYSAQPQPGLNRQQLIAADIVAALKAVVAEEVRVQIVLLLEAARLRESARTADASNTPKSEYPTKDSQQSA
jgi:hypothetical protein